MIRFSRFASAVICADSTSVSSAPTSNIDRFVAGSHARQREHDAAGRTWRENGYVFCRPDGSDCHPNYFTKRLQYLIKAAGLPPVRLHDIRHGAAA